MKYFVYKYYDDNENIIYVGKTKDASDIGRRIKEHSNGNDREKEALASAKKIQFAEFKCEEHMNSVESILINVLRPKYNIQVPICEQCYNVSKIIWNDYIRKDIDSELKKEESQDTIAKQLFEAYMQLTNDQERLSFSRKLSSKKNTKLVKQSNMRDYWMQIESKFNKLIKDYYFEHVETSRLCPYINGSGEIAVNVTDLFQITYYPCDNTFRIWRVYNKKFDLKNMIVYIENFIDALLDLKKWLVTL